ncbi:hypothetical protein Back2_00670 [Nocardioides baekrokdamisoli]|uniref:Uncharacterized protein n=1 Tax=Nocardioides baekrokdamisoli TaxID=1804624 RepID=A0A3G9IAM2_9ACTN|nr:hypothetical protein Back2_00670 [Nocardioides baekrokdamisoli]
MAPKTRVGARIAVAGTGTGLIIGGIAVAAGAGTNVVPPRIQVPPGVYAAQTATGPGTQAAGAASSALAGLAQERIVRGISFVPSSSGTSSLPMVQTTLSSNAGPDSQGGEVRATWLGAIAEGAVSDRQHTNQASLLQVIGGGQVVEPNANGTGTTTYSLGAANVAAGQVLPSPSDSALTTRASDVAAKFGLTVQSVTLTHPLGTALDVTFTVPDGLSPTWTMDDLRTALAGAPIQLDGVLITLVSPTGTPLLVSGATYRAGFGGLWFATGQDVRFGAGHGSQYNPGTGPQASPSN